jgi:hypothetical protein
MIFHRKVSAAADDPSKEVSSDEWNDLHSVDLNFASPGPGRVGTTENRWYGAGVANATPKTTGAPTANRLRALPLVPDRDCTLEGIACNVTTLLSGNIRLGVYEDNGNLYPGALLYGSGTVSSNSTGVKSFTGLSVDLKGGELYWAAYASSAAATIRALAVAGCWAILGTDSALGVAPGVGWDAAFTFAALPNPYPSGASVITAVPIPAVFIRAA